DGGGIRGYSSLLIVKRVMQQVAELEGADSGISIVGIASQPQQLPLPCHYFDYIFGSSTGGLSAIMLGRLRMGVDDCLKEYNALGSQVF
ncbi:hypothetical protein K440DRAFT_517943, partial [Wilcoxina mikolae CBS 423.85]